MRGVDPGLSAVLGPILLASGLALVGGCSSSEDFPDLDADAGGDGQPQPGTPDAGPTTPTGLPMTVDDWYAPSGYMGDGSKPGGISHAEICADPRPAEWKGRCHRFIWTPGSEKWGGVYWQYPDGNWGAQPGLEVPKGATKVSFYAWGAKGGEVVSFMAGMMAVDGFELKKDKAVLTATPTQYVIDLGATSYDKVVGGFGWAAGESATSVTVYVDDVRWE